MATPRIDSDEMTRTLQVFREFLIHEELFKEVYTHCSGRRPNSGANQEDLTTDFEQALTEGSNNKIQSWSPAEILMKIECVIQDVVVSVSRQEAPLLTHGNTRSWDNVRFQAGSGLRMVSNTGASIRFDNAHSVNKFALTIKVLSEMYDLIKDGKYCTKRDLYYQDVQLYGSQSIVDSIVDNISCMLAVPRWKLHVLATSKGCVAGDLQFRDADGNLIDCNRTETGVLVPNHVAGISNLTTRANFVLIIEKDATFQKLLDEGFATKFVPCILITGKGFPDVNTRLLVRQLWDTFHLPILALVDADPHGIEIMAIYKYGSRAMSFETPNLTVPSVRWLGVLPSDVDKLHIKEDSLLKLTARDVEKAKELLTRPYFTENAPLRNEIELILKRGRKAEIQCLTSLGQTFLTDVYIPNKILSQAWL